MTAANTRPVWVEINLNNIRDNFNQMRKWLKPESKIMAVVKADAYGHGMVEVARTLVNAGTDRLAVALPEEGAELREAGFSVPIQVLGELLSPQYSLILEYDLIPTISSLETAFKLNKLAQKQGIKQKVHLKVDTGMGRIGISPEKAVEFILKLNDYHNLILEGLMTHFATADEADKEYTHWQWKRFSQLNQQLEKKGIKIPLKHAANSAAVIDLPEYKLDMVRPGIILYGLNPSAEVAEIFKLKPALSWKAKIVFLKEVPAGTAISYGATFTTTRKSRIATIPLGYADGYFRLLSNQGEVLINEQRASIRGRVCMDQFMVDVTEIPDIAVGDEVVLIGRQGEEEITATELADKIDTINYEIICAISKRVSRIYM